ncbi:hypothetical protein LguiA_007229 [Lonicera macranthoides]
MERNFWSDLYKCGYFIKNGKRRLALNDSDVPFKVMFKKARVESDPYIAIAYIISRRLYRDLWRETSGFVSISIDKFVLLDNDELRRSCINLENALKVDDISNLKEENKSPRQNFPCKRIIKTGLYPNPNLITDQWRLIASAKPSATGHFDTQASQVVLYYIIYAILMCMIPSNAQVTFGASVLIRKTKVVEQQRDRNTSRSIEILKQKIMKPRKENELLERRCLFQRRSGKAQKNADKNDLTPTGQEKKKNMMWTLDMDKCLIDALVVQCHEGNKVEKCFEEVALKQEFNI